ncbi:zinc ABC transporter substrate-binding protein, partial [Psychrobacter sp. NPDC078370]
MNAVFTYSVRSLITLQRLLMTGLIVLGTFTLNAQAATVSVSNYPLFLLSEAVTEGAPSANRLLQAGEVG